MKYFTLVIIYVVLVYSDCAAQSYIEPILGSRFALNNKVNKFLQLSFGTQYSFRKKRNYDILLQCMISWPISKSSTVQAYSTNPSLPEKVLVDKTVKPYTLTFALGHRLTILGGDKKDNLAFLIYTGLVFEKITVNYAYDKSNYVVLNPDKTLIRASIFVSGGLEYQHKLPKGKIFGQILIASPPFGGSIRYPSTFNFITALSINLGYAIPLKKT